MTDAESKTVEAVTATLVGDVFAVYAIEWTKEYHEASAREGWFLVNVYGESSYGPLQVDKVDDPVGAGAELGFPVPDLDDDEAAWRILRYGTQRHHEVARSLLARFNPAELERVMRRV